MARITNLFSKFFVILAFTIVTSSGKSILKCMSVEVPDDPQDFDNIQVPDDAPSVDNIQTVDTYRDTDNIKISDAIKVPDSDEVFGDGEFSYSTPTFDADQASLPPLPFDTTTHIPTAVEVFPQWMPELSTIQENDESKLDKEANSASLSLEANDDDDNSSESNSKDDTESDDVPIFIQPVCPEHMVLYKGTGNCVPEYCPGGKRFRDKETGECIRQSFHSCVSSSTIANVACRPFRSVLKTCRSGVCG